MLIQPPWNDFKALWNLGKDSLTKPMPRKFCGVNQDAELGSTHISVVWQGSCAHQQLVLLRNSEIPAPVTGYTVGSTDSSVSGKSFLVRLSSRDTLTNSKVQLFPIPLCCTAVMPTPCAFPTGCTLPHSEIQSYQKCLMQTSGGCWHCLFRTLTPKVLRTTRVTTCWINPDNFRGPHRLPAKYSSWKKRYKKFILLQYKIAMVYQ